MINIIPNEIWFLILNNIIPREQVCSINRVRDFHELSKQSISTQIITIGGINLLDRIKKLPSYIKRLDLNYREATNSLVSVIIRILLNYQ